MARIGALTIGAAPRADLLACIRPSLRGIVIVEAGALDGIEGPARLPTAAADGLPLETRLADGRRVVVEERRLLPRLQTALDRLESSGVELTVLLCAGGFDGLRSTGPLIRPFEAAVSALRTRGVRRFALVVPFAGQAGPAAEKWRAAGLEPVATLIGADLGELGPALVAAGTADDRIEAIVLDYVGHHPVEVAALRHAVAAAGGPPVVDPAEEAGRVAATILAGASVPA